MAMTPEQCRAARGWLDWSQDDLASAAHVSLSTVRDFEKGRHVPIPNNLVAMRVALEAQGIDFVDSGGTCEITYAKPEKDKAH
jgi:DNA-binding transcriptional regulator YiaG